MLQYLFIAWKNEAFLRGEAIVVSVICVCKVKEESACAFLKSFLESLNMC